MPWLALSTGLFVVAISARAPAQQRPDTSRRRKVVLPSQISYDTSGRLYGSQRVPRSIGASMGVIDSATLAAPITRTLSELLAARVAGVSVLRSSGVVGTGSRVRLRGASGLFAPREPIVILDGVRIDATQNTPGLSLGGQQPSRLDDIDVEQVARIEILRGPAASALYGTDGAGGVIRITTRTPNQGSPAWTMYAEGGISNDATRYPANYSTGSGVTDQGTCPRADAALGSCSPGPLLSWNPLENASPFRTATRARVGTTLNGGWGRLGYLASGSAQHEQGILEPNDWTRVTARLNVDAHPVRTLIFALRSSYIHSRTALPFGSGSVGVLANGLLGNAIDDPVNRGYRTDALAALADVPAEERIERTMGSLTATWKPVPWLSTRAVAGKEIARRDDDRATDVDLTPPRTSDAVRLEGSSGRHGNATLSATTTASVHLARSILAETTVGIERLSASRRTTDSSLVRGQGGTVSSNLLAVHTRSHVTGLTATERVAWLDRRFLGIGVRRDRSTLSAFGPSTFFSGDAAWVMGDEPFFPRTGILTGLRLRGAYGRSADDRLYAFAPSSSSFPFVGEAGYRLPSETISEAEVGVDAFLLHRLWVESTWYRQRSADALTVCCFDFPPAANGRWHTTGLDAAISADLVRTLDVEWSARLNVSVLANRVEDVGQGRRVQNVGPTLVPRVRFANVVGHPIAGIWGNRLRVHDDNGDRIITPSEVDVAADSAYLGSSAPTREIGLTSTVAFRRVTITALLDYRGGFRQINATADNRCEFAICGAIYDPNASLDGQARAISVDRAGAGFVEDATFVRLRELSVTWKLLPGWAYRHALARLDATVAARNLLTFTGYSGLDPEINYRGQTALGSADFHTLPLPRSVSIRLDFAP